VSVGVWAWIGEDDRIFLEYSTNTEGIFEKIFLEIWHRIYHDVEKYSTTCTWMNNNYGWNIIVDEKRWMKHNHGWKRWINNINGWKLKWMNKIKWM
jgi:hypothetical protein